MGTSKPKGLYCVTQFANLLKWSEMKTAYRVASN